ncbi:MAG TPA: C-GCAxxG-C-C family protein [Rhodocyclaceae bacterium]|nr:C-GCAxxG-C-C family protein [Rhodocyclaceae bacterium]
MADDDFRVAQLALQGYKCSHILVQIGLDALGRSNPDLLRAMSGLANGMGDGLTCGALTGGCCLIGLYAGMDGESQGEHGRLPLMLEEYTEWFREEFGKCYGGIDCAQIMQDDPRLKNERCPALILAAVKKAREILEANGFELDGISGAEQG